MKIEARNVRHISIDGKDMLKPGSFEIPTGDIEISGTFVGKIDWVTFWQLKALTAPTL